MEGMLSRLLRKRTGMSTACDKESDGTHPVWETITEGRCPERRESRCNTAHFVGPSFPQTLASVDTVDGRLSARLVHQPTFVTLRQGGYHLLLLSWLPADRQPLSLRATESRRSSDTTRCCQTVRCPSLQGAVASPSLARSPWYKEPQP